MFAFRWHYARYPSLAMHCAESGFLIETVARVTRIDAGCFVLVVPSWDNPADDDCHERTYHPTQAAAVAAFGPLVESPVF